MWDVGDNCFDDGCFGGAVLDGLSDFGFVCGGEWLFDVWVFGFCYLLQGDWGVCILVLHTEFVCFVLRV